MSEQAGQATVNVTINGTKLAVPAGELVVESVKRLGLEIPIFCYHPRMDPVGMCRMCLVEVGFEQPDGSVRMMPKPQAGCTLPASEGMVVVTDSEALHRDRKGVLEFLLINHPLDCPICDRGGECPLQNNTMAYGPSTSRFVEVKRHLPKAFPLSKHVTLDLERCIQCGRCVRFTEEVSGDGDLAFRFRGAQMQPSTFQLTDFESRFSGNVIEICPVGALTSAHYRFRARPWDLEAAEGVCTVCSNGCNVWVDHRAGRFVRINGRTNEDVNEEWTCDRGKFGHEYLNSPSRATTPMIRRGDALEPCTWDEAYQAIEAAAAGSTLAALVGDALPNEALWELRKLFHEGFGTAHVDWRPWGKAAALPAAQSTIAGLEEARAIVVVGTHLAADLPIVHLRARKAATRRGVPVGSAYHARTEIDGLATVRAAYAPGALDAFVRALESPSDAAAQEAGTDRGALEALAALVGPGCAVLTSDAAFEQPGGAEAVKALARFAQSRGADFDCWPRGANARGAQGLGLVPGEGGMDTPAILAQAAAGGVGCLWLAGSDPTGSEGGRAALEGAPFVVVQTHTLGEAAHYASVVLPMAAPAEQDGTWTNCEGRVQRMKAVLQPPGQAKPAWRIAAEMRLRLGESRPVFSAADVMDEIAREVPAFGGCAYSTLPPEGAILAPAAAAAGVAG